MAACDDCFHEFVHPLIHAGMEKNELIERTYGRHAHWDWDDETSILTFSDPKRRALRIHCSVVGTTQGEQWQWSWANNNILQFSKLGMDRVREFGEANGYEQLTTPFLDADEHTGWEMTAVAEYVLNGLGGYRFPTDYGHCYLVYRRIEEFEA